MTPEPPPPPPVPGPRRAGRRASRLVDIAEAVGVHTSTVSRVLNGDPAQSVRPEIYEKIWRTARQQGYRPNAPRRRRRGWGRAGAAGTLPTACAVGSLNQMFGVMAALRAVGLSVPADMSLVSLDEDECLAFLDVPVTSVTMPLAELGSAAVDALIARIGGEDVSDVMIREPMGLVHRDSVSPPPGS